MRTLHVIGLPHTQTTDRFSTCAYTAKVKKFATMMHRAGWPVVLYSGDQNEAECTEHVACYSETERVAMCGEWNPDILPDVKWGANDAPYWHVMNGRAIAAMATRIRPGNFLCLISGYPQAVLATAFPQAIPVEWAVGYEGVLFERRVFESHAWQHHVLGLRQVRDGSMLDDVIPNFFDPADFPFPAAAPAGLPEKYLLFIGRLVRRKGVEIASQIAARAGLPLVVAGPGAIESRPGFLRSPEVTIEGPHIHPIGAVGPALRAQIMAGAMATMVPTIYVEPFGGVAVESMMAGTPVIASDWGAFPETVIPGISGARFRSIEEAVRALPAVMQLDRARVRQYAIDHFGLAAVAGRFGAYFERLEHFSNGGR